MVFVNLLWHKRRKRSMFLVRVIDRYLRENVKENSFSNTKSTGVSRSLMIFFQFALCLCGLFILSFQWTLSFSTFLHKLFSHHMIHSAHSQRFFEASHICAFALVFSDLRTLYFIDALTMRLNMTLGHKTAEFQFCSVGWWQYIKWMNTSNCNYTNMIT